MSYSPKALGSLCPTGCVVRAPFARYQAIASSAPYVSPVVPPRAAYSQSSVSDNARPAGRAWPGETTEAGLAGAGRLRLGGFCFIHLPLTLAGFPQDLHFSQKSRPEPVPLDLKVVAHLEVEPKALGGAEEPRQAQGRVRRDGPLPVDNLIDPAWRHAQPFREAVLRQPQRAEKVLVQHFSRVDGRQSPQPHTRLLVVIDNLDVVRISPLPTKAHPPLTSPRAPRETGRSEAKQPLRRRSPVRSGRSCRRDRTADSSGSLPPWRADHPFRAPPIGPRAATWPRTLRPARPGPSRAGAPRD